MLRIEFQRLLGLALLNETKQCIDDDDAGNDRCVEPKTEHQFDEARSEQDVNQDIVELQQEAHQWPALRTFRQSIWTVLRETARRLVGIESFR